MRSIGCVLLLAVLCAGFTSCQKEITGIVTATDSTGGGGTSGTGSSSGLLRKTLVKSTSNLDSSATYYTYNSNSKIISRRIVGFNFTFYTDNWSGYERNSGGLIVRSKQFDNSGTNPFGSDTVVTNYYYSSASPSRLQYYFSSQSLLGLVSTDSTVYTYNTSGGITKTESYETNFLSSTPTLAQRSVYSYDAAGNCSKIETSSLSAGIATATTTSLFEYDAKTPPFTVTNEEAVIISSVPVSIHNVVKSTVNIVVSGTTQTSVITDTYTYSSTGKPVSGTRSQLASGSTTNSTLSLYYQ